MKKGHRWAPDITGQKFGKLTVIRVDKVKRYSKSTQTYWLCECECGNFASVETHRLKSGYTKSCGCLVGGIHNQSHNSKRKAIRDERYKKIYRIWIGMKTRCYNQNAGNYKYYGEKGISVCDEWKDNFQAFYEWSVSNGYKDGLTIDRIDGDKDYSPDNCRWATMTEQARNTKQARTLEYNGETKTFSEWSEITGIHKEVLKKRIKDGWSAEKTLNTPSRKHNRNKEP